MLPEAQVVHRVPGRIRLRIAEKRGDRAWFDAAALALATARGVERVGASARTGSLLLRHAGDADDVLAEAAGRGVFTLVADRADDVAIRDERPQDRLRAFVDAASTAEWVALILFLASILQVARRDILPPAVSLLAYAASALIAADRRTGRG